MSNETVKKVMAEKRRMTIGQLTDLLVSGALRRELGMDKTEFARLVSVMRSTIRRIEGLEATPRMGLIFNTAAVLRIGIDFPITEERAKKMTNSQLIRESITHELKIYPEFFSAVCTGVKRAELRRNDRDYRVGDTLHLLETPRGSCHSTGEFINATITHIADVGEWMPGYVLLSVKRETVDSEPIVMDGLVKAVEFYEQVKRENPPVETGAWKDAVDWVLKEACRAAMLQVRG